MWTNSVISHLWTSFCALIAYSLLSWMTLCALKALLAVPSWTTFGTQLILSTPDMHFLYTHSVFSPLMYNTLYTHCFLLSCTTPGTLIILSSHVPCTLFWDPYADNPTIQTQDSRLSHLLWLWTPHLEFTPTRPYTLLNPVIFQSQTENHPLLTVFPS